MHEFRTFSITPTCIFVSILVLEILLPKGKGAFSPRNSPVMNILLLTMPYH